MILTVRLRGVDGHRVVPRHGTHLLIRGWRGRLVFICKDHIWAESGIFPVWGFVHKCTCNNYLINIPYTEVSVTSTTWTINLMNNSIYCFAGSFQTWFIKFMHANVNKVSFPSIIYIYLRQNSAILRSRRAWPSQHLWLMLFLMNRLRVWVSITGIHVCNNIYCFV